MTMHSSKPRIIPLVAEKQYHDVRAVVFIPFRESRSASVGMSVWIRHMKSMKPCWCG